VVTDRLIGFLDLREGVLHCGLIFVKYYWKEETGYVIVFSKHPVWI